MINGCILIRARVEEYDYGWCAFDVTVKKGDFETQVYFYCDVAAWSNFGLALQSFPSKLTDYVLFESAHNEKILLKAYCYDTFGHTALSVSIDNQKTPPNEFRLHFSLPAEVASLNQLGRLLANWEVKNNSELYWEALTS